MRIAGIETSASLIAQLALRLHTAGETALSWHVGRAVDHDLDEVDLSYCDCKDIVRVLKEPPAGLETIYGALQREASATKSGARR